MVPLPKLPSTLVVRLIVELKILNCKNEIQTHCIDVYLEIFIIFHVDISLSSFLRKRSCRKWINCQLNI